ncbi:hypothetical protein SNE25_01915 [Mucilaginibacter sabulilitoris]|uniref:Uncharacterized protein n=1 Tax=Mucilaginibacter sabulilitoris TaxID=1173583 RepID=A0ABZ0TQ97_9SPHI|nr:hypothetical protein [Mucilaginibacter sabulilitoris]WPU94278.1 hypothetical protein SNE25_01915 [Mucilaginibacter sabulilitoris]
MIAALLIAAWSFIAIRFRKSGWFKTTMIRVLKSGKRRKIKAR